MQEQEKSSNDTLKNFLLALYRIGLNLKYEEKGGNQK